MPKKYRYILAFFAIIGAVNIVWYYGFYCVQNPYVCIAGALAAMGGVSLNFLLRAYLRHDRQMKRRKNRHMKDHPINLIPINNRHGGIS